MTGWIVYHPKRKKTTLSGITVYHDKTQGNQDPYVWQSPFLHTFCHMYQMRPEPEVGDIILWVSSGGDKKYPHFSELLCDLVFVVKEKVYWKDANNIEVAESVVDSLHAYADHYVWGNVGHHYKHRRRFTLKADENCSFQAQTQDQLLMDIVPILAQRGITIEALRKGLHRNIMMSGPMRIDSADAEHIRKKLVEDAAILLRGRQLELIRKAHPSELMSPPPTLKRKGSKAGGKCC